jgi:hypothetical protein
VSIKPLNVKELEKNQRFGITKRLKMKKEKWNESEADICTEEDKTIVPRAGDSNINE